MTASFGGFPAEAPQFFAELERNNNKSFWQSHKATYDTACAEPMQAFLDALRPEFGEGRMFRPYRDIRFSADKSPYRTECAAHIGDRGYVSLSADGLYVGGGCHGLDSGTLRRFRDAIVAEESGTELASIVATLRRKRFEVDGDAVRTTPRGYDSNHPRIELLRMKELHVSKLLPVDATLSSPKVLTQARAILRDLHSLVAWLDANCPMAPH